MKDKTKQMPVSSKSGSSLKTIALLNVLGYAMV